MLKKTIANMQKLAEERDGKCLSNNYKNSHSLILWECKDGHKWSATPTNIFSNKSWCPFCAGQKNERSTIEHMRKIAQDRGGDCLSKIYVNSKTKLLWRCSDMHIWEAIPLNVVNKGSWCPICHKNKRSVVTQSAKRSKKPDGYWNKFLHCRDEAVKYKTRSHWQKISPLSYRSALKNDWVERCSMHMLQKRAPNGYWTLALCKKKAQLFKTKSEWRLTHPTSYGKANKEGWLPICCEHMTLGQLWFGPASILEFLLSHDISYKSEHRFKDSPLVSRRPFDFYLPDFNMVVEFHGEQHLTGWGRNAADAKNIQLRDLIKKNWAVENGMEYFEIKQWEIESKEDIHHRLRERLQTILRDNKKIPALLFRELSAEELQRIMSKVKWTQEACVQEAEKYDSIKEWRTSSESSYQAAYKKKWLEKCCSHMSRQLAPKNYWSLQKCLVDAKQYKTVGDWARAKPSGYAVARSKKWFVECTHHMIDGRLKSKKIIWTHEKCIELARQCSSRSEFKKKSGSAYLRARVNGWLDECCAHMSNTY